MLNTFKNIHLVPQIVIDTATILLNPDYRGDRTNYEHRIETTRNFCDRVLDEYKIGRAHV